jgi:hypothetical protein
VNVFISQCLPWFLELVLNRSLPSLPSDSVPSRIPGTLSHRLAFAKSQLFTELSPGNFDALADRLLLALCGSHKKALSHFVVTRQNLLTPVATVQPLGGQNVFLTGAGGTGKTTELCGFIVESPRHVSITAPTGVAALNAGGMTIHRITGSTA